MKSWIGGVNVCDLVEWDSHQEIRPIFLIWGMPSGNVKIFLSVPEQSYKLIVWESHPENGNVSHFGHLRALVKARLIVRQFERFCDLEFQGDDQALKRQRLGMLREKLIPKQRKGIDQT